jgi:hypothetical protein
MLMMAHKSNAANLMQYPLGVVDIEEDFKKKKTPPKETNEFSRGSYHSHRLSVMPLPFL